MSGHRTFAQQYTHYFDRPSVGLPTGSVGGNAAWTAADLNSSDSWRVELAPEDILTLERAFQAVTTSGLTTSEVSRSDLDIGHLGERLQSWAADLSHGCGVLLISGLPVDRWGLEFTEMATWCLGLLLGEPGAQNPQGDLLGHVRDAGSARFNPGGRLYRTNASIRFHCDYADVVGLMCVHQAVKGGESRIASSAALHDELWRRWPKEAARLYEPVWLDTRGEGNLPAIEVTPFAYDGRRVRAFYHSDYFRSAGRHGGAYVPDPLLLSALDRFDELAASPLYCLSMRLRPGDLQLVSNHSVVHSRSEYEDDPTSPRHLLRLWLSIDDRNLADR